MDVKIIQKELKKHCSKERARNLQRFFKTGPGEYGEGDIFIGLTVPQIHQFAKQSQNIELKQAVQLLKSPVHEARLLALFILTAKYTKADPSGQTQIYKLYLKHTKHINNWDLVDLSAYKIIGHYLFSRDRKILYTLAKSESLWERRIAIIATAYFIRENDYTDTLRISRILLKDKEDLIHKAVGWMLREVGKRDLKTEEGFLIKHYRTMPRTMLRYAIEKFPEQKRQSYLKGRI